MSNSVKATLDNLIEEIWNNRRLDLVPEVFSETATIQASGHEVTGHEAIVEDFMRPYQAAFPDLHITIKDCLIEGDKAAMRFHGRGTHTGEFEGKAATGGTLDYDVVVIFHLKDGRITDVWGQSDRNQKFAAL